MPCVVPSSLGVFILLSFPPLLLSLRCYCTEESSEICKPYGACEGGVCMVGILRDNNQVRGKVIRTCGNRPLGCFRDVDERWTDLCACDEPFCNTFSFLRQNTQKEKLPFHVPHQSPLSSSNNNQNGGFFDHHAHNDFRDDPLSDHLVFERVDRPDDSILPPPDAPLSTQSSPLTLLLVIVPLTVGGATILVVAMNYYCHLC